MAHDGGKGGAVLPAISALTLLCLDGFLTGAWAEAWQTAEECLRACQFYGHPARAWMAREHLAMIAAARGDDELVRELTGEMLRWAMPRGIALAQMAVHRASSLAALGRRDFEEAYREAAEISPPGILTSHAPHALWTVMDLVEAAVLTGRHREATAHVAAAREARIADISPRLALLVTTSAALAAPADQAGHLFEQALGIPGAGRWPFEFARVQLAFGEHLRRVRAPSDARVHLGAALAAFRVLGARPWADRAVNELRAARLTLTKTEHHRIPALTAQEHQIASLAAAGLTNKQIGQRLYLSPRTVGSHLYRVFPKLGVSSRAGLRDALMALASGDRGRDATSNTTAAGTAGTWSWTATYSGDTKNFGASSTCGHESVTVTPPVPAGSCEGSGSISALVSGTNVTAYVPKGNWNGGATGIDVVNVEGSSITNTQIPTGPDVINSCASNSVTGQTVCTANNNDVYVLKGTGLDPSVSPNPLTDSGTGTINFSGRLGDNDRCVDGRHGQQGADGSQRRRRRRIPDP